MSMPHAGWYPDESLPGGLRWWDGTAWTQHRSAPVTLPVARTPEKLEPLALVLALVPLIGIVGGFVSLVRGKVLNGGLMILIGCLSIAMLRVLPAILAQT